MTNSTIVLAAAVATAVAAATSLSMFIIWGDRTAPGLQPETATRAIAELEREIESLRGELDDLRGTTGSIVASSEPGRVTVPTVTDEQIAAALDRFLTAEGAEGVTANTNDRVKQLVESMVQDEVSQQQSPAADAPKLSQVAATLELEPWQRETLAQELTRAHEAHVEVLSIPAADGTLLIDDVLSAYTNAEGLPPEQAQANMIALWGRLATEVIPGTAESYADRMTVVGQEVSAAFRQHLSPAQWTEFEKLGLEDPTQIELPGSAWDKAFEKYAVRRLQKK